MAHPSENFPINSSPEQTGASGFGAQHDEAGLFVGWFDDKLENFNNTVHRRTSAPLDLNLSTNQGLSLSLDQEAPPQQFLALQEQMKFMREQMTAQQARFVEQQAF